MNEMQDSSHEKKKHTSKFLFLGLICAIVGAPILGGTLATTMKQVTMETATGTGWNNGLETASLNTEYEEISPTGEDKNHTDTQSQSLTAKAKNAEKDVTQLLTSIDKMRTVNADRSKKTIESTSTDSNNDAQLNQLRDEILRLQDKIRTLQEQIATRSNQTSTSTVTYTTINNGGVPNKVDDLSDELDELIKKKEQLEAEIAALKASLDGTTQDNSELKKTIENKEGELDTLNKNLDASKNEAVLLREELVDVYDAKVENNTLIFTPHVTQTEKAEQ